MNFLAAFTIAVASMSQVPWVNPYPAGYTIEQHVAEYGYDVWNSRYPSEAAYQAARARWGRGLSTGTTTAFGP